MLKTKEEKTVPIVSGANGTNEVIEKFILDSATPPVMGDTVEGPVITIGSGKIYIDLPPFGTGIIYGREYLSARPGPAQSAPRGTIFS